MMDDRQVAVTKMGNGNLGAIHAMLELMSVCEEIDPQANMGNAAPLLSLDKHGIYGTEIYILFNDKCDRDPRRMLILLRAVQLGLMSEKQLKEMAEDQMYKINPTKEDWKAWDAKVCAQLKDFQKPQEASI